MKKNEQIDWHENENLNTITRRCLDFLQDNFSFNDYLDDRAQKDNKFVKLDTDGEGNENGDEDGSQKNEQSEFSFSEEDEAAGTAD